MKIVKKVGTKLEEKLKSGELKESELLKEASEILKKMDKKGEMKKVFEHMGMPQKKFNSGAFRAHIERNLKKAALKEKMQKKLQERPQKTLRPIKEQVFSNAWVPKIYTDKPCPKKKKKKKKRKKN